MIQELAGKIEGDALGLLTQNVAQQIQNGATTPKVDPNLVQKLRTAQNVANKSSTGPLPPGDTSLAGTVSSAVQKIDPSNRVPNAVGNNGPVGSQSTMKTENDEGKMGLPTNIEKRDRDPRHPANKGVSANPGFVGG